MQFAGEIGWIGAFPLGDPFGRRADMDEAEHPLIFDKAKRGRHDVVVGRPARQPLRTEPQRVGRLKQGQANRAPGQKLLLFRDLVRRCEPGDDGDHQRRMVEACPILVHRSRRGIGIAFDTAKGKHLTQALAIHASNQDETPGLQAAVVGYAHRGSEHQLELRGVGAGFAQQPGWRRSAMVKNLQRIHGWDSGIIDGVGMDRFDRTVVTIQPLG